MVPCQGDHRWLLGTTIVRAIATFAESAAHANVQQVRHGARYRVQRDAVAARRVYIRHRGQESGRIRVSGTAKQRFDRRFFLYFEDYDLSLRSAEITRIAYVPAVKVVHHGGHAARKGLRHIGMFVRGAALFFRLHGWKWL